MYSLSAVAVSIKLGAPECIPAFGASSNLLTLAVLNYFLSALNLAKTRFSSSSFCPASPNLPSAVRR
jgi:hypothetical protein